MSDLNLRGFSGVNLASPRLAPPPLPAVHQAAIQPLVEPQSAIAPSADAAGVQGRDRRDGAAMDRLATTSPTSSVATPEGRERLTDIVNSLNQFLQRCDTALRFEIDDQNNNKMVVRIVDRQTEEVVRQIPSEKALAFAKFFEDLEKGQHLAEVPQGVATKDHHRLKVEGWLLDAKA